MFWERANRRAGRESGSFPLRQGMHNQVSNLGWFYYFRSHVSVPVPVGGEGVEQAWDAGRSKPHLVPDDGTRAQRIDGPSHFFPFFRLRSLQLYSQCA